MTTPMERAEKIVDGWQCVHSDDERLASIEHIAAELEAYAEERVKELRPEIDKAILFERVQARAEAFETCAKIAENAWDYIPQETWNEGFDPDYKLTQETVAERIRAKAKEDK